MRSIQVLLIMILFTLTACENTTTPLASDTQAISAAGFNFSLQGPLTEEGEALSGDERQAYVSGTLALLGSLREIYAEAKSAPEAEKLIAQVRAEESTAAGRPASNWQVASCLARTCLARSARPRKTLFSSDTRRCW